MTKYRKQFQDMLEYNHDLFTQFKTVHDAFAVSPQTNRSEFNAIGQRVLPIIRRYENELCMRSEGGKYGKYSENLSEKFWEEIRHFLPLIDQVETPKAVYKKI